MSEKEAPKRAKKPMWLVRLFVKDYDQVQKQRVRESYGRLSGAVGIVMNLLLSASKFLVGLLSGSVSVTADAANNLSDAGSSVITILSFKLSSKPADEEHPFGHERIEYVASIVVAFIIFIIAFQLVMSSFDKILHPETPLWNPWTILVLALSILVKLWLFLFNRRLGKAIDSTVMQATAMDSLSDVYASSAVLLSQCISPAIGFSLDGYMGLVVAGFIVTAGVGVLREALDKLLGPAPTKEMTNLIAGHILKHEGVLGMHDLMLHSYGPGRYFASVHVEVDAGEDILKSHDMIDNIEREVAVDHGIHLVIHLDPVVTDDERTNENRRKVQQILQGIDKSLTMHDFRMVEGVTHTNLIFDVVVPHGFPMSMHALQQEIIQKVRALDGSYYAVVTLDADYTGTPSNKTH